MLNTTHANPDQRPRRPRKIRLDCDLYCPHSVRASAGDASCDHDFEAAPTATRADCAVWNCTRCGREFSFEVWKSRAPADRAAARSSSWSLRH